jgi:hypothetical protein
VGDEWLITSQHLEPKPPDPAVYGPGELGPSEYGHRLMITGSMGVGVDPLSGVKSDTQDYFMFGGIHSNRE